MRRSRSFRSSDEDWINQPEATSAEARQIADQAEKLIRIQKRIWGWNLGLIGLLLVVHLSIKFVNPGFPAAEYLAIEIGALEALSFSANRRLKKKVRKLKVEFTALIGDGS